MNDLIEVNNSGTIATTTEKPAFSLKSLNLAAKCPAVVVAPTGVKISKYPFPKVKFEEGRRTRLAILTQDVLMVKLHYHPEVGYIICDGDACCKYCDKVSIKYCYPVVVYTDCNEAGKPISKKIEVKMLAVGGEIYDNISLLSEINESVTGIDLIFSCTSAQYQKCQVTQAGAALWQTDPDLVKQVQEYMEHNADKILDAIGKSYTAEQLAERIGDNSNMTSDQKCLSAADISEVFNV